MAIFDKKYCDICSKKIGLLGNRKLVDANMCKNCAALLSPFMTDRRKSTLAGVKAHLAYREANKAQVAALNVTRTLGSGMKVMIDEAAGKFIVTSSNNWRSENPDVIALSQVAGCEADIVETRTEVMMKGDDGEEISYSPPKYDYEYDFFIAIRVDSPWFSEIKFQINSMCLERGSDDYKDCERLSNEIKQALAK